jgi:folate-binding protein YgfZ
MSSDPIQEQVFAHRSALLLDRTHRGILDLEGKDAARVMNGVFSSAASRLEVGQGQWSTLLTPKGRLIAAFQLHALAPDRLRLVLLEPLRDTVTRTIHKYAFLGDIALVDRSAEIGILSLEGPAAGASIEALTGAPAPGAPLASAGCSLAGVPVTLVRAGESPEGGIEVWAPRASLEPVRRALLDAARTAGGGPGGSEAADALRIEAGIARQGQDYTEDNFPNDAGWEHALTYDKCYVGQEVVARMRTYGQANRKLLGVRFASPAPPAVPAVLRVGGEEAGSVTSAAFSARLGGAIGLAMLRRKHWEAAAAVVEAPAGAIEARIVPLPFVRLDGRCGGQ